MMVMMMDGGDSQMVLAALVDAVVAGNDWCNSGKWQCGHVVKGKGDGGEDLSKIWIWVNWGLTPQPPPALVVV